MALKYSSMAARAARQTLESTLASCAGEALKMRRLTLTFVRTAFVGSFTVQPLVKISMLTPQSYDRSQMKTTLSVSQVPNEVSLSSIQ